MRIVSHKIRITDPTHDTLKSFKKPNETDAQVLTRVTDKLEKMRLDYLAYEREQIALEARKKVESSTARVDLDEMFNLAQKRRLGR